MTHSSGSKWWIGGGGEGRTMLPMQQFLRSIKCCQTRGSIELSCFGILSYVKAVHESTSDAGTFPGISLPGDHPTSRCLMPLHSSLHQDIPTTPTETYCGFPRNSGPANAGCMPRNIWAGSHRLLTKAITTHLGSSRSQRNGQEAVSHVQQMKSGKVRIESIGISSQRGHY